MVAESLIEAMGPQGPLRGVILQPEKSEALVLIIPGSGPVDRDGNSPFGMNSSTLRLLSEGLSRNNISSIRIDKRGLFGSSSPNYNANKVKLIDYVNDMTAWISEGIRKTKLKSIWILGHSEGGLVALMTACHHPEIAGIILVATPGRPLAEILAEQMSSSQDFVNVFSDVKYIIDELNAGRNVDVSRFDEKISYVFHEDVQDFLIDQMKIDPLDLTRKCEKPILVIQGGRDIQISIEDAYLIKKSNPLVSVAIFNDVNHVLKSVSSNDRAENISAYLNPNAPIPEEIIKIISEYVKENSDN